MTNNTPISLPSVINPEKEKTFDYLVQYLSYKKINEFYSQERIEGLYKEEKAIHNLIFSSSQSSMQMTLVEAWGVYIDWVRKLIPGNESERDKNKDQLRLFLVLENFTKSICRERNFSNSQECMTYWVYYIEMCSDDLEVLKFMKKNEICSHNYFLYESMGIIYEKFHQFREANACYLEGIEKNASIIPELSGKYKQFQTRMENRLNREIKAAEISSQAIDDHIRNEINKLNAPTFNANNKRNRHEMKIFTSNFVIRKRKFEFLDDRNLNLNLNLISNEDKPGAEGYLSNIHSKTKATQLVEIYTILVKFLLENDKKFALNHENFLKNIKEEYKKKPLSWINPNRFIPNPKDQSKATICEKTTKEKIKVEELMNKMADQFKFKENIEKKLLETDENKKDNHKINEKTKENLCQEDSNKTTQQLLPPVTETISQDGQKIRLIKIHDVGKSKKDVVVFRKNIGANSTSTSTSTSLTEKRISFYFNKLAIEKKDMENKRKTLVYKVDSDGDLCMSSEEEPEIEEIKMKDLQKDKTTLHGGNTQVLNCKIKIATETAKKLLSLASKSKQKLNPFDVPMTLEEINEKMGEVTSQFSKGQIDIETRNRLYSYLEEKIDQIGKSEENIKGVHAKEILNNNAFDLDHYLKPQPPCAGMAFMNKNTNNPSKILLEIPKKPTVEEAIFPNVSRSLDFTNIKLIESNRKLANKNQATLGLTTTVNSTVIPANDRKVFAVGYNNTNTTNTSTAFPPNEDFSPLFDSDHSYIFKPPADSLGKCAIQVKKNFFQMDDSTPETKYGRMFNNIKESIHQDKPTGSIITAFNNNVNKNNNTFENKPNERIFTDINSIFESKKGYGDALSNDDDFFSQSKLSEIFNKEHFKLKNVSQDVKSGNAVECKQNKYGYGFMPTIPEKKIEKHG